MPSTADQRVQSPAPQQPGDQQQQQLLTSPSFRYLLQQSPQQDTNAASTAAAGDSTTAQASAQRQQQQQKEQQKAAGSGKEGQAQANLGVVEVALWWAPTRRSHGFDVAERVSFCLLPGEVKVCFWVVCTRSTSVQLLLGHV